MGDPVSFVVQLLDESLIPISDVPKHSPIRVHLSTCHRWHTRGVREHKLETVLIGGRRYTSLQALARFWAAISGAQNAALVARSSNDSVSQSVLDAEREMGTR
jgi:hypothetical protein